MINDIVCQVWLGAFYYKFLGIVQWQRFITRNEVFCPERMVLCWMTPMCLSFISLARHLTDIGVIIHMMYPPLSLPSTEFTGCRRRPSCLYTCTLCGGCSGQLGSHTMAPWMVRGIVTLSSSSRRLLRLWWGHNPICWTEFIKTSWISPRTPAYPAYHWGRATRLWEYSLGTGGASGG